MVRLYGMFSLVLVPEIHWLLSDLLAFPDTDDTFLSFCLRLHAPSLKSFFPSRVSSHGICCILQATMDQSLPSFVGCSEKRAGWPVHSEADVFVCLGGVSGCDCLNFLMTIGEIPILS